MTTKTLHISILVMLLALGSAANAQTRITGLLIDKQTGEPVEGAEVAFFTEDNEFVFVNSTTADGSFEIITNLQPGDELKLFITRYPDYKRLNFTETITRGGNQLELELEPSDFAARTIVGHVYDYQKRKNRRPIAGASISFLDENNELVPEQPSDSSGLFQVHTNISPGKKIDIFVAKMPDFPTMKVQNLVTAEEAENRIEVYLRRKGYVPRYAYFFGAGGGLLATGLFTRLASNSAYDKHKNFENPNRVKDYDTANSLNKVSIITTTAGSILAGVGLVLLLTEKNRIYSVAATDTRLRPLLDVERLAFVGEQVKVGLSYNF